MVGVEQWAEIRRMHGVERLAIREISRRTGLHRKTIRRALAAQAVGLFESIEVEEPAFTGAAARLKKDLQALA